ncbi:hypothetical protein DXF96_09085 [Heyndrickxia coagulans]|nr:hypothetical protein DXF96_09085 [Heyndrickxia coagulans]
MPACIRFLTVGWRFLAIFQCLTHGSTVSRSDFHQVPFLGPSTALEQNRISPLLQKTRYQQRAPFYDHKPGFPFLPRHWRTGILHCRRCTERIY